MKHSQTGIARKFLFLMVGLLFAFGVNAQTITVHGVVTDHEGEPLIGASVVAEGTSAGTSTNIDGEYTINVAPTATLLVSYVGYETMRVPVEGRTEVHVTMSENSVMLNEVVAIGYGTVKKSDATGSVAVVKPDEIEAGLATSVQDMLVGQTPGVVVTTSGGPEGKAEIRIRGGASLSANNDPLIVIDGVPISNDGVLGMSNPLAMVNPENVESMTILKDASATAIYGSRASNGVIIITTKKGKAGKPQVNFSANLYVDHARKNWKVLNAAQFRTMILDRFGENSDAYRGLSNADTDWQDEVFRTAVSSDYALSVAGTAKDWLPYNVSASYTNSNGILKTSKMDRVTLGFNLSPKFFDNHLQVNANVKGYYIRNQFADEGSIGQALSFNPTAAVYDYRPISGGGTPYKFLYNGYTEPVSYANGVAQLQNDGVYNPVASLNERNCYANVYRSNGNLQLDYALHFLPELHLNLNLGYDVTKSNNFDIVNANSHMAWKDHSNYGGGESNQSYAFRSNTLLDFYLNYKKDFEAIKSGLDVTAGYSWQRFAANGWNQGSSSEGGIATTPGLAWPTYDAAGNYYMEYDLAKGNGVGNAFKPDPVDENGNYHWRNHLQLLSFFGRLNYTLMGRYLLTATVRGDATSRFSKDNRWGIFPAVALGWKINDEAWMENAAGWLSDLKLRLGWGQTGQQDVGGYYNYIGTYTIAQPGSYYVSNNGFIAPYFPDGFNPDLKWETTTTSNIGIDYGFFNNRIAGSIEAYYRKTTDLLAYVDVPAGSSTVNKLNRNIGSLENYGVEFNITAKPIVTQNFTWTLQYNVGWNHNQILNLEGNTFEVGGGFGGTGGDCMIQKEGYPAYSFNLYQQVYDADGRPIEGVYVDQNGDGVIDGNDKVVQHSKDPKVTMTFGSQFRWKQWDLGFTLRASIGNYVYASQLRGGSTLDGLFRNGYTNVLDVDQYFETNQNLSDYWLRNASFVRCDNITLGYTFEDLLNDQLRLRIFAGVQNPFVITKYKGLDPEVASGVDGAVYPRATTWSLGVVASF